MFVVMMGSWDHGLVSVRRVREPLF
jgi:hypothetical protein